MAKEFPPFEERLNLLEIKLTFQDEMIEQLNSVITELRQQIDRQEKRLQVLVDQIPAGYINNDKDSKPPHY